VNPLNWTGLVIREHTEDTYLDIARIVHDDPETGRYYSIPFPAKSPDGKRYKHHIQGVSATSRQALSEQLGPDAGQRSLVQFVPEGLQRYSEAMLREMAADPKRKDRRDIQRSLQMMDMQWAWIEPHVAGASIDWHLDDRAVNAFAAARAPQAGVKPKRIKQTLLRYVLGGQMMTALLPRWDRCNQLGKPKLPRANTEGKVTSRAGRRNMGVRNGFDDRAGIALPEDMRRILRSGWRKFKKRGVSAKHAYALTMGAYFPESVERTRDGLRVKLLPPGTIPTLHQFRRHGPGKNPAMSATRINLGKHHYARNERPLTGKANDGLVAACQLGFIDSTPEDQNLVSAADPMVLMPQSHNSKVVEAYTGYIGGFYSSFERPSTMTALLSLAHAEQDKVEFCARYGVTITPEEWVPLRLKTVEGDNGEAKSEKGIHALTTSEISLQFAKAYAAELKGPVESAHHVVASGAGHLMAGSSQGRRHERGDENPAKDACQTHEAYMTAAIQKILRHNNIEPADHLLTNEMRRDKVKPTRAAVLQWLIKEGYVASAPTDTHTLRTHCLPVLKGVLTRDGVRVFDPRKDKDGRFVPHLRYSSKALHASGLTDIGRNGRQSVFVHLDPSHVGTAWLAAGGLIEMVVQHKDPEVANLTLLEWLQITDSDRLNIWLDEHHRIEVLANDGLRLYDSNKEARARKRQAEQDAAKAGAPRKARKTKAEAGAEAIEAERLRQLGCSGATPTGQSAGGKDVAEPAASASANDRAYDAMVAARLRAAN
jgi:hypothetical protein